ncbi:MAG: hypothetical protein RH949_16895 [Coleofasciculus sp. A1-SPW-01]|uniref:hypothetical protein n=1 Tax=Coleofasciculus sp. A1-SPW-01 TaxID=3070819 RepID=UPI0032F19751
MNVIEKRKLLLVKILLLLILLSMAIVGKRIRLWPIVTWSVYSTYSEEFPASNVSTIELRVISSTGKTYTFSPPQLSSMERDNVAKKIIEKAFDDTDLDQEQSRTALVSMVQNKLFNIDIKRIEKWQIVWDNVEPLKVPPLNRNYPTQELILGSFDTLPR